MKPSALAVPGIAVLLAASTMAIAGPLATSTARAQSTSPTFEATFDTDSDFYDRFDYGVSGFNQLQFGDGIHSFQGDHDENCGPPTTSRTVNWSETPHQPEFFWHCAPGGDPAKGHVMTALDTTGYDIAWFSPRQVFSGVSEVCWDINITSMSHRKWTQVLFVSEADAVRYPSDKGTGGYELGYTNPDFREDDPNTGVLPADGNLAGLKNTASIFDWFQDEDVFTERGAGWPGLLEVTDKAARFQHCIANQPNGTVRVTQDTPDGTRSFDLQGQIPQNPVRVVFQDDNYDPSKDERYDANAITWHWDNIRVTAASAAEPPPPPPDIPSSVTGNAGGGGAAGTGGTDEGKKQDSGIDDLAARALRGDAIDSDRGRSALAAIGILALPLLVIGALCLVAVVVSARRSRPGGPPPRPQD